VSRSNNEDGLPRPYEFPLGSAESRAAARAMLEAQERGVRRLQIIFDAPRPRREGEPHTKVGPWFETEDGGLMRYVFVPPGTDEETLRRLLAV
jgi:hypothetical protein